MRLLFTSLLALALSACSLTAKQEQAGANVMLASEEPTDCEDLGTFFGSGNKPDKAMNGLLNAIGEDGGNRAYIISSENIQNNDPVTKSIPLLNDVLVEDHVTYGRGYKCTL